uniref:RBR-type E3 ubiquitin transferase n=1 Tax=Ditylenchus dipsaci TaxID=166011 RepID=A0A915EUT6_9BILA
MQSPIEKNGGCNRIVCGKSSCHYQFCWSCLKDWNVHGYNASCNKFDEEEAQKATGSRVSLQRYLHYYNRFTNHKASLKLEAKLSEEVEKKMLQMQKLNFSYVETQFLQQSVLILTECRRTLMYTYALGFYLLPSNAKQLFEDNQQDLEVATEQLSEFLERDMEQEEQGENNSLQLLSQKVKDKARYVHRRRLVLEEQCLESTEKKMFVFDETLTKGIKF